jgi:hypothetical protein
MTLRPLTDQTRLESGLVILRALCGWRDGRLWRVFGSWAIFLHSGGNTRLPHDLDVEVSADDKHWVRELPVWGKAGDLYQCAATEPRRIRFSRAGGLPIAYWQDVEVTRGRTWLSTETVNWVWRGPDYDSANLAMIDGRDVGQQIGWNHALIVPSAPLEECLALKWTRISKERTGGRRHTRWEDLADLYDVLVLRKAQISSAQLRRWVITLSKRRGISSPFLLPSPPLEWMDEWDYYNFRTRIQRPRPDETVAILNELFMTYL